MTTIIFKETYFYFCVDKGEKKKKSLTLAVCFLLLIKREKREKRKSDTCYLFLLLGNPQPSCLLSCQYFPSKNTGVGWHFLLKGFSQHRDGTWNFCIGRWVFFYHCATWENCIHMSILTMFYVLNTYGLLYANDMSIKL